ncbi:hypothetical protein Bind_0637 [Beijerinckia indica subsp. indica ATCC 9039]|uniref:Rho termination factor N-terminal domain-containing protein n=1 Tax=Beijerinckia indica subsp. indica (strain ATCC 9039 / DSM 1715 / NCIMB 8712) TaxID=395963 RepID=B2IFS6_BEII9|nr:hypothetical protein Bind_0637 [Beijerinckia indica subsp. indica ATCC 9039]
MNGKSGKCLAFPRGCMPGKVKLYAPSHFTCCSVDGHVIEQTKEGAVVIPEAFVPVLIAHGFTFQVAMTDAGEASRRRKDINVLTRRELCAFLRSRGVKGYSKMSNAELRALALEIH